MVTMQFEGLLAHLVGAVQSLAHRVLPSHDIRGEPDKTIEHQAEAKAIVKSDVVMYTRFKLDVKLLTFKLNIICSNGIKGFN